MKVLLDTHILLWWLDADPVLSQEAIGVISNPENTIFVSAVSLWEIWLKQSLGKLRLPADSFESLPLTAAQTAHVGQLAWVHRDPFDRMLVAQAQADDLVLLTADEVLAGYGPAVRLVR